MKIYLFYLLIFFFGFSSCELFNNEQELFDDYGFEEGPIHWEDRLLRYKGHFSLKFKDYVNEELHNKILEDYGIETVYKQYFDKNLVFPGFYRVTKKAASQYYTSYTDTTIKRLGNRTEVEYLLPAYELDDSDDICDLLLMTNQLTFTFLENSTKQERLTLIDSLQAVDGVVLKRFSTPNNNTYENLVVTKSSDRDPYALFNHYLESKLFETIDVSFGQISCF